MKQILIVVFALTFGWAYSQSQQGFYLNHNNFSECKFTQESIYFVNNNIILDKIDYVGNTIWSKSFTGNIRKLTIVGESIYFFIGQSMVKLDTSGNVIWARNFSAPGCIYYNYLNDIIPDRNNLLVMTTSGINNVPGGMIIIDSSGSILNSWCDFSGNGDFFQNGFPLKEGRAWLTLSHGGIMCGLYARFIKTDSLGFIDTATQGINLSAGVSNTILDLIPMPDSSYLVINKTAFACNSWSPWNYQIVLSNITANGTILWQKNYYSSRYMLGINSAGADSLGNIYFLGYAGNDTLWKFFTLLLDPIGNIKSSVEWVNAASEISISNYSRMVYHNGYMYSPINKNQYSGVIITDSAFTPPCGFSTLQFPLLTGGPVSNNINPINYTSVSYPEISDTINASDHTNSQVHDLCLILDVNNSISSPGFDIYPNPAFEWLNIVMSEISDYTQIVIYNLLGEAVLSKSIANEKKTEVEIKGLNPGLYIVKIETEKIRAIKKLIVN